MTKATSQILTLKDTYETPRLRLTCLSPGDAGFILALLNMPQWKQFIGDRNVHTEEEATGYIRKIMANPAVQYRVVRLKEDNMPIGIVTLIKKDYLEHQDVGFAFLQAYTRQGYAYEAMEIVLNDAIANSKFTKSLAVTMKENTSSIRLLLKFGFTFSHELKHERETLFIYSKTL